MANFGPCTSDWHPVPNLQVTPHRHMYTDAKAMTGAKAWQPMGRPCCGQPCCCSYRGLAEDVMRTRHTQKEVRAGDDRAAAAGARTMREAGASCGSSVPTRREAL